MIWLQITANTGPAECCLAVAKALTRLCVEGKEDGVQVEMVDKVDGDIGGTFRSILLQLDDASGAGKEQALAARWSGTILWICDSPYRKLHKRKNWFVSGSAFAPPDVPEDIGLIRYEATRASGPGGQHVNKTDSAIRATHVATGLSVKVQTERSQHANKRLAAQLLANKLEEMAQQDAGKQKADRRQHHHTAERGNAIRVFSGIEFREKTT